MSTPGRLRCVCIQADGCCVVDLTAQEEAAVGQGSLQVGVNARGQVCHVRKRGSGAVDITTLQVGTRLVGRRQLRRLA